MLNDAPGKQRIADQLAGHLHAVSQRRRRRLDDPMPADFTRLKAWQADRLAATHADLLADPRYRPAARFFLEELYGTHDFTVRDAEVARILPTLVSVLPVPALTVLTEAVKLDDLSESLDDDMVKALRRLDRPGAVDTATYRQAYAICGRRSDRERQIMLVGKVGAELDRITRKPLLATTLSLMRRPAQAAGLGDLHRFLDAGFRAFRHMKGSAEFLEAITQRETAFMASTMPG